jgi:hypothetical protein
MKVRMPWGLRAASLAERPSRAWFSGVSPGAIPRYVWPQGSGVEPPEGGSASHSKAQLRLPSVPMQVVLREGRGWRFLRQRRSVVWVWTKPGVGKY